MSGRIPRLCRHKRTNRAYVTDPFSGREHYLGTWGAAEARAAYDAWVRAFLTRRVEVPSGAPPGSGVSLGDLIADYMDWARGYYRKDGRETSEIDAIRQALWFLNERYGDTDAGAFGPAQLKAVREAMISGEASRKGRPWSRSNINEQVQRIRRLFRWGVEHELVRPETLGALMAVPGLRKGRSAAQERAPVAPVDLAIVEATLPRLDRTVRAMVEVQLCADMRPGEVVIMRAADIDLSQEPWLYVPSKHKTEHHGKPRRIWLGPRARIALQPFLAACADESAWLFPSCGRGPNAAYRGPYTVGGYRKAIREACRQEPTIPHWNPNRLRHTAATEIRRQFGLEAAQVMLGHASADVSQVYAERDERLARKIAEEVG